MPKNTRHFVFTAPVYDEKGKAYDSPKYNDVDMHYLCYGYEVGKDGYEHLQGYIELKTQCTYEEIQDMLGAPAHLALRRGSKAQAIAYCKKDGKFVEFGVQEKQGERQDLGYFRQRIDFGASPLDLAKEDFGAWCRNYKAFALYANMVNGNKCREEIKIHFLFGPPGTGKSTWLTKMYPQAYWRNPSLRGFWDGYYGQETVVCDEYRHGQMNPEEILSMISCAPHLHNIKGTAVWSQVKTLVICSNYKFEECFPVDEVTMKALTRRVEKTYYFSKVGVVTVLPTPTSPHTPQDLLNYPLLVVCEDNDETPVVEIYDSDIESI